MKKIFLLFICFCSLFVFVACDINSQTKTPEPTEIVEKYVISFETFNKTEAPQPIKDVTYIPSSLPKLYVDGYDFLGWYYDANFTKKALPADTVSSDITLYAKLVEIVKEETPTGPVDTPTQNDTPVFDDTNKIESSKTCTHEFVNYECTKCSTEYDSQVYNIFKSDTIIYDNDSSNPYNIDLNVYGSDVKVIFYDTDVRRDIYPNVTSEQFYSNYRYAKTYEEAYFRTQHHFMSGDITDQGHLTPSGKVMSESLDVRCTTAIYILDFSGAYLGYIPNSLNGENHVIWYGGAYISHNDVAAYLYAFGEAPVNNKYDKSSGKSTSVNDWGKYGRVNVGTFSANSTKYKYQPKMPTELGQKYTETDFGTLGGYYTGDRSQSIYNNGKSINRGAARFCFVNNKKSVDERYVFYTYNHYNDFQEYLNYEGGFGTRFGNEAAGNPYCYDNNDYTAPPTQRANPALLTFKDLLNLI